MKSPVLSKVLGIGVLTALAVGVPTDIIDTPWFSREVPVRWWEYPVLVLTVALTMAWFAIQVPVAGRRTSGRALGGVVLAVFAVGCPVCNKLVLAAVGVSGALGFWAPLQPLLAAISLLLLVFAVARRWQQRACLAGSCASGSAAGDAEAVEQHRDRDRRDREKSGGQGQQHGHGTVDAGR